MNNHMHHMLAHQITPNFWFNLRQIIQMKFNLIRAYCWFLIRLLINQPQPFILQFSFIAAHQQ